MDGYFAVCDGKEEHVVHLSRREAIRHFGTEVISELDEMLPPSIKPRVPEEYCPGCWEHLLRIIAEIGEEMPFRKKTRLHRAAKALRKRRFIDRRSKTKRLHEAFVEIFTPDR